MGRTLVDLAGQLLVALTRGRGLHEVGVPGVDLAQAGVAAGDEGAHEGERRRVPDGAAIARAIDFSRKRWPALVRYLDDPTVPIDNNHVERQIRPVALGRSNWLFAGSLRAGQRAAAVMRLIQSAKLNGHDPYAYLKDVLTRLPTHKAADIAELRPHRWTPSAT